MNNERTYLCSIILQTSHISSSEYLFIFKFGMSLLYRSRYLYTSSSFFMVHHFWQSIVNLPSVLSGCLHTSRFLIIDQTSLTGACFQLQHCEDSNLIPRFPSDKAALIKIASPQQEKLPSSKVLCTIPTENITS